MDSSVFEEKGPGKVRGDKEGSTYHWVARLKHLTEQNPTLLPGKWFSEGIQDTRVPGVKGIWTLKDRGRAVLWH